VRPVIINSCGARLRDVRVSFVTPTGAVRRVKVSSVGPGGKRRATVRTAWPSKGVVTGRVEGGGTFELGFDVGPDGVLSWPLDASSPGPVTPEATITGAACNPGGALRSGPGGDALPAAAARTAAAVAAASGAAAPAGVVYNINSGDPAAGAEAAAANAAACAALAPAAAEGVVAPAATTTAVPDRASTPFNTPVDIYILRNDVIPDPANTDLFLFSTGSAQTRVQLASPSDDGGATENAAEGDNGEVWSWTYNAASFQAASFLTYTPPRNFLGGNIVFNYTVCVWGGGLSRGGRGTGGRGGLLADAPGCPAAGRALWVCGA
jgi:hypothetical protein